MKRKQMIFLIGLITVLAYFVVIGASGAPFGTADIWTIIKLAAIFLAFNIIKKSHIDSEKVFSKDIIYRLFILLAALVLLNRGIDSYSMANILKSMMYIIPGLVLLFAGFGSVIKTDDNPFSIPVIKPEKFKTSFIKFLISFALACTGVFFYKNSLNFLGTLAYAAAIIQLMLINKFEGVESKPKESILHEQIPGGRERIISAVMIAGALFFYFLTLTAIRNYSYHVALIYMILGSALFGFVPMEEKFRDDPDRNGPFPLFDVCFAIFIFVFGLFLFSFQLMDVPPGIHGDENVFMDFAKSINSGIKYPFYISNPQVLSPSFSFWFLAFMGKIFGLNIITARWLSIVISSGLLTITYLTIKDIFNRRSAVLASLFLSCFFMVLLYSRHAITWMHVPALATASFYLLYVGLKKGNPFYFIFSGVLFGLNLYFYNAAKISPMFYILFPAFLLAGKQTRRYVFANWKNFLLLVFAAIIIYLPMIYYIFMTPADFFGRVGAVSLFKKFPPAIHEYYYFCENILKQTQMFFTRSANGYGHNLPQKPFFDFLTGYMAVAGIGCLLFTWRRISSAFLNMWLFTGMMAAYLSVLGPEDPFPSRVVLALPAILTVVAIGIDRLWSRIEQLWPKILKYVLPLCALYIFAWYAFYNLNNFFVVYKNDPHTNVYYRSTDKLIADYMIKNSEKRVIFSPFFNTNYYFQKLKILDNPHWDEYDTGADVSMFELYRLYDEKDRAVTIIGEGIYRRLLPAYKEYFPEANVKIFWDTNFWQFDTTSNLKYCYDWMDPDKVLELNKLYSWYYVFDSKLPTVKAVFVEIPGSQIEKTFALTGQYSGNNKNPGSFVVNGAEVEYDKSAGSLTLKGLIDVPDYKKYEFKAEGGRTTMYIDNSAITGPVLLYKGLHRFKAVIAGSSSGKINLQWKTADEPVFTGIPRKYLINSDKLFGLTASYRQGAKVIYKQLEPAVDYRVYWFNPRPAFKSINENCLDIDWEGTLTMRSAGIYSFILESKYNSQVIINGVIVYKKTDGKEYIKPLQIGAGRNKVKISANYVSADDSFRFMYKQEGWKIFDQVTYSMLSPDNQELRHE